MRRKDEGWFKAAGRVWRQVGEPWDAGGVVGRVAMARPVMARGEHLFFAGDQEAVRLAEMVPILDEEAAVREAERIQLRLARQGVA